MDFLEWARSPWGQNVPIHIAWFLIWVAVIAGLLFFIVHATYLRYFAKPKEFAISGSPLIAARIPEHVPRHSLTARLFHWIMAVSMFTLLIYRLPPEGRHSVRLGHLSLDRGVRSDRLHPLSHRPRLLLHGLLVDLAGQD